MKPVKAWALLHKETQKCDGVFFYASAAWLRKAYSKRYWQVVRVEIREVKPKKGSAR